MQMMQRFVVKNAAGKFLSTKPSMGRRTWVNHINDANLFRRVGDAKLALYHVKEVIEWMRKNSRRRIPPNAVNTKDFPVSIMTFDVLLIDASKGYIG